MKTARPSFRDFRGAFTLIELMVTSGVVLVAGTIIFLIFNSGMVLFAKNTAINLSHQDTRVALARVQRDINQAVSIPYYVNASLAPYATGTTAAAEGVSFQVYGGAPGEYFEVYTDAPANSTTVQITGSSYTPVAGQRLIIPTYQIEYDISNVTVSGSGVTAIKTLTLATPATGIGSYIDAASGGNVYATGTDYHIICYITNRVYYVAVPLAGTSPQAYELRYYPRYNATYSTSYISLIRSLYAAQPFQISTVNGSTNNRYVQVSLTIDDPNSNNRGYLAMNVYLSKSVPYLNRMTTYQ